MDDIANGVLAFLRWAETNPLPPDVPTREVVALLRCRLDADSPGWRLRVFRDSPGDAVEVEVHLGARVVRGVLAQRSSRAA